MLKCDIRAKSCVKMSHKMLSKQNCYFIFSTPYNKIKNLNDFIVQHLYRSIAGRYQPVSYPDGPITARYRFIKNAYWDMRNNLINSFLIYPGKYQQIQGQIQDDF